MEDAKKRLEKFQKGLEELSKKFKFFVYPANVLNEAGEVVTALKIKDFSEDTKEEKKEVEISKIKE